MPEIILSYVLTTYNKLPYLRQVLTRITKTINADEEIIVTDGGSTDGTAQYLDELFQQNKIHGYVSERDLGEGHGFNKAIFMAKGKLIKLLTDDDDFYVPAMRKCKELMLQHSEVDIILGQMGGLYTNKSETEIEYYETIVRKIKNHLTKRDHNFITCGITMMIRRSSIPKLGLFSTTSKLIDHEFFHRVSGIARMGVVSIPVAVRISNPQSVLVNIGYEKYFSEIRRTETMHGANKLMELKDFSVLQIIESMTDRLRTRLRIRSRIKKMLGIRPGSKGAVNDYSPLSEETIISIFNTCDKWLEEKNYSAPGTFTLLAMND